MSLEQLVMLALFILLPLLDGLMRMWRQRTGRPQNGRPDEHVAQAPPSGRWSRAPNREVDEDLVQTETPVGIPPQPAARPPLLHNAPERLMALEGLRASRLKPDVPALPEASRRSHERAGRDLTLRWMGSARDLRRAIVLTTILGPCRALEPGGAP